MTDRSRRPTTTRPPARIGGVRISAVVRRSAGRRPRLRGECDELVLEAGHEDVAADDQRGGEGPGGQGPAPVEVPAPPEGVEHGVVGSEEDLLGEQQARVRDVGPHPPRPARARPCRARPPGSACRWCRGTGAGGPRRPGAGRGARRRSEQPTATGRWRGRGSAACRRLPRPGGATRRTRAGRSSPHRRGRPRGAARWTARRRPGPARRREPGPRRSPRASSRRPRCRPSSGRPRSVGEGSSACRRRARTSRTPSAALRRPGNPSAFHVTAPVAGSSARTTPSRVAT